MIYSNGNRCEILTASVCKNRVYVTIKAKCLSQRLFEAGGQGDQQLCLQHNPEKTKYRCSPEIDVAVEGHRSYKGVRSR